MADCWGIVLSGGAPAVDGLQRVLSLPEELLYSIRAGLPQPPGPVRVLFSDAGSRIAYPDPALDMLRKRFDEIYGSPAISESLRGRLQPLLAATPAVARALLSEPFQGLGGKSMVDCGERWLVHPSRIRKLLTALNSRNVAQLVRCPPLQGLAILGFARLRGDIPLQRLNQMAARWLSALAEQDFRGDEIRKTQDSTTTQFRFATMRTMQ
jgi:hypothetical protein